MVIATAPELEKQTSESTLLRNQVFTVNGPDVKFCELAPGTGLKPVEELVVDDFQE